MKKESYLIEFRLNGRAKKYAKELIFDVSKKFNVQGVTHKRPVPHVSLFGPFQTYNSKEMVKAVVKVCKRYDLARYSISGFNHFDNHRNKVVFFDIKPSQELKDLRWEISKALSPITKFKNDWDKKRDFSFHATIAFKDIDKKFQNIIKYLRKKEKPKIKQLLIRVSIIKNGLIMNEYDFMQKRLLSRNEAKDPKVWKTSINILKNRKQKSSSEGVVQKSEKKNGLLKTIKRQFSELIKWSR
jgi:2'-5' RNA ligase